MLTLPFLEVSSVACLLAAAFVFLSPSDRAEHVHLAERTAVATLRDFHEAQQIFLDRANHRSFGLLPELMGAKSIRSHPTQPPLLKPLPLDTILERNGYLFALFLPSVDLRGALKAADVDESQAGEAWVAFAWPIRYPHTGRRLFAIGKDGVVMSYENALESFEGPTDIPPPVLFSSQMKTSAFGKPPAWVTRLRWIREP